MKKITKWMSLVALIGLMVITAVCNGLLGNQKVDGTTGGTSKESTPQTAEVIVEKMTPEEKVGQLMMVGILAPTFDQDASWQLSQYPMGNVILFDRNMESQDQVKALTKAIDGHVTKTTGVKPFIAVDQEGGQVLRMRNDFPAVPSEAAIGQTGDPGEAKKWAVTTGQALKELGINVNFAPVIDLGSAAERSYSDDPDTVIAFAKEAVAGYKEAGIWSSLKHFPGIGKVKTDPHIDGDSVTANRDMLDQQDLRPFAELIPQIDDDKTFIMVSNITFPALDPNLPACVSKPIMTDLLRNQYHYQGLILSDDMEMGAMAKHYAFKDMGVMAIKAGADMVLVCHDYGHERETYEGLLEEYKNNSKFKQIVDKKVLRIVRTKLK